MFILTAYVYFSIGMSLTFLLMTLYWDICRRFEWFGYKKEPEMDYMYSKRLIRITLGVAILLLPGLNIMFYCFLKPSKKSLT